LLAAVHPQLADALVVERSDLPADRAQSIVVSHRPDKHIGRRDFLRRLAGALEPDDCGAESRRVVFGRGLVTPVKRARVLAHIGALAADLGQDMPAKLMPAIEIADVCESSGLCAAICPTGALCRDESKDTISLRFVPALCIACGECQRACPSKALCLWPDGDGTMRLEQRILIKRRTIACESCGDRFVPIGDAQLCPFCEKSATLMREVASLKRGSPV